MPELANTGYVFETREEAFDLAEVVPGGEISRRWEEFVRDRGVYLAAGIAERKGSQLYNSSVLIGPDGTLGAIASSTSRNRDKLFFEPDDLGLPVFHTPLGRLAMYVFYVMNYKTVN